MAEKSLVTVSEYITLKQLPVIDERLRELKEKWETTASDCESMVATEENNSEIKKIRSGIRKEFSEVDSAFKEIKKIYMGPWNELEKTYKECVKEPFERADASLKGKSDSIDAERITQKTKELYKFYEEYRQSLGLDAELARASRAGIKITLSDSMKSLKEQAKAFLDRIDSDLKMIDTLEDRDEIYVEYRMSLNVTDAVTKVNERRKAAEEQRKRREAEEAEREAYERARQIAEATSNYVEPEYDADDAFPVEDEPLSAPVAEVAPEHQEKPTEKFYVTAFRVSGTIDMLRKLKAFLEEGGYQYESLEEE